MQEKKEKRSYTKEIIVGIFLLILAIATFISIRGSYLEYKELGENFISVFTTNIKYKYIITGINFILLYIIIYFSNRGIKKGLKVFFDEEKKEVPKLANKSIALIISAIVSIIISIIFVPKVILFASNVSFGEADPVFNLDISFYMFVEPLLKMLLIYIIGIFVGLIIYTTIYYIVVFNKYFDGIDRETLRKSYLIKHIIRYIRILAIIFAIYILITTLDIVFDNFITTDSGMEIIGAGVTNVRIKLWGTILFAAIIIFSIFRATINWKQGKNSKMLKDILLVPGYLVVMFVIMLGYDLIFVNSNEYDKEKAYIESNINNTKMAYGIECDDETIEYSGTVSVEEVEQNQNILNNIAYISKDIILQNLKENQSETGYYTYNNATLLNQNIDGRNQLVYIAPREITNNQRTYNSKTYEYTHGYGLIVTSATTITEDGNIRYIQNDIAGEDNTLNVKKPQIYYGLETNNIVVTQPNGDDEYDYTDNRGNEYKTSYQGNSGLQLNWYDRLILGMKKGNIKLAFSSNVTKDSKILINRNIIERAKKALPNVIYDENPYTVVDENGDIYWVLDAYTTSSSYPYSTYTTIEHDRIREKINYIRNSIKVIINAYDGSMKFYITDRTDPIAMAYRKMYPSIFEDLDSQIPSSISEQFIYPDFLYDVQSTMIEEYHNIKSDVLYRSDDTWEKATYNTNQNNKASGATLESYYTMVNDNGRETLGLIQFFTQNNKQNLVSYLVGTVENGTNKLKLCKMSSDTGILGPTQLDNQISQDETIQNEIDSLSVTGARVTKDMIIVPIGNTLLYVEPIYQTMINESDIPVLKKIVVASGNKVAIGNNLREALESLVSQYATSIDTYTTEDIDSLIDAIIKSNNNLTTSMEASDWDLIGSDIKRLQELISSLEEQVKQQEEENQENQTENDVTNSVAENVVE